MKGKRIAAFALTLVLGASAAQPALAADWQSKNPLIAHALGEADGKIETNSKEAFLTSWQNGFRALSHAGIPRYVPHNGYQNHR